MNMGTDGHEPANPPPPYTECCKQEYEEICVTFNYDDKSPEYIPSECYDWRSTDEGHVNNISWDKVHHTEECVNAANMLLIRNENQSSYPYRIMLPLFIVSIMLISCGPILLQRLINGW